ncbi:Repressible high-affinity phosphate permease [Grifola frondosa]|uniref:Repressible high-affinity phosphate permease n=1 Tax=Grifola frondosa TaxID=5627 RepID=A0A1C7M724_GRIFR|nr:Repressible high-affinity phosphate permease [Grifola frondosa]
MHLRCSVCCSVKPYAAVVAVISVHWSISEACCCLVLLLVADVPSQALIRLVGSQFFRSSSATLLALVSSLGSLNRAQLARVSEMLSPFGAIYLLLLEWASPSVRPAGGHLVHHANTDTDFPSSHLLFAASHVSHCAKCYDQAPDGGYRGTLGRTLSCYCYKSRMAMGVYGVPHYFAFYIARRRLASQRSGEDGATGHINERRRALLAEIDNARFSWFHAKVALVSGAGFFTDAYDIFAINIVATMLGSLYGSGHDFSTRTLGTAQEIGIKIATPVGILFGQLLFGWLGDVLGRKRIYGLELIIIMIATFGQTVTASGSGISLIGVLIVWRVAMGIGIGGDYPISAVISSEFSSIHIRGRVMTAVFANQGWGQLMATLVSFIVVLDQMWRLIIGLGCVPAAFALYFRLTIPETPRFTMDIERNIRRAADDVDKILESETYVVDPDAVAQRINAPRATNEDFTSYFSQWQNLKVLVGTAYSWFALDIAFYGLGLNSTIILNAIGFGTTGTSVSTVPGAAAMFQNLRNVSLGNVVLSVAGFVPGYWVTFPFIDSWGRKPIQFMGFAILTVLFITMGFGYDRMIATSAGRGALVFLYCLANFFENFGPNTTTFIIPGEVFPTRYRSTAHGISAASGKFGAVIAQIAFQWLKDVHGTNKFLPHILEMFAFFMFTGIISTLLVPETNQKSLEVLSNESQDEFIQEVPMEERPGYLSGYRPAPIRLHSLDRGGPPTPMNAAIKGSLRPHWRSESSPLPSMSMSMSDLSGSF